MDSELITGSSGRYGGGYSGGYDGGFDPVSVLSAFGAGPLALVGASQQTHPTASVITGVLMIIVIILFIAMLLGVFKVGVEAMMNPQSLGASGFGGTLSAANMGEGAVDSIAFIRGNRENFMNGREGPYYPDVTNRVLHMENREKDAVRAMGKINQERLRRAATESELTGVAPLEWGEFWNEWKQSHPLDGEVGYSGESMTDLKSSDFVPY